MSVRECCGFSSLLTRLGGGDGCELVPEMEETIGRLMALVAGLL